MDLTISAYHILGVYRTDREIPSVVAGEAPGGT
jgi:hypothetical protein